MATTNSVGALPVPHALPRAGGLGGAARLMLRFCWRGSPGHADGHGHRRLQRLPRGRLRHRGAIADAFSAKRLRETPDLFAMCRSISARRSNARFSRRGERTRAAVGCNRELDGRSRAPSGVSASLGALVSPPKRREGRRASVTACTARARRHSGDKQHERQGDHSRVCLTHIFDLNANSLIGPLWYESTAKTRPRLRPRFERTSSSGVLHLPPGTPGLSEGCDPAGTASRRRLGRERSCRRRLRRRYSPSRSAGPQRGAARRRRRCSGWWSR
jgi:hypothetical protein